MSEQRAPVFVGIDGSEDALSAVAWAAEEAERRHAPLQVVYANMWPLIRGHWPANVADQLLEYSKLLVRDAVDHARNAASANVTGTMITGDAVPVLLECSRSAQLVVVGSRGLGGFTGMLLGSTAVALAGRAACPIIVVRALADDRRGAPVGVGLATAQPGPRDLDIVRFAFEAAAARGTGVHVLHTVTDVTARLPWEDLEASRGIDRPLHAARDHIDKALGGFRASFATVPVQVDVRAGRPAAALVELSGEARLVVVGCRGRGGVVGLLLGSVSQALLHHARSPVAVLPPATVAPGSSG